MLFETRLKKIRLKQQKKLNSSYLALYKNITSYIHLSTLRRIEKEEVLQEILDIMLQAQLEGKPIDLFIGEDYEVFCDSIIEEYNKDNRYRILNAFQSYIKWTVLILILNTLLNAALSQSLSNLGITISQFIIANTISIFIVPMSREIQKKRVSVPKYQKYYATVSNIKGMYAIIAFIAVPVLLQTILEKVYGKEVLDNIISTSDNWHYLILAIITIILIEIYKRVGYRN